VPSFTTPTLSIGSSTLAEFRQRQRESDDITGQNVSNIVYAIATVASTNRGVVPGLSKTEVKEVVTERYAARCNCLPPTQQQMQ
jgi:hypothetical protein